MKIGILETDRLSEALRRQYGSYGDMIQNLLQSVDESLAFPRYQVAESDYPETIDDCDAYLITGSKSSIYDNKPWIKYLHNYVITLAGRQKKLIGICFGHQIIAEALGGQVQKSEKGWGVGLATSTVYVSKPWMDPAQEMFTLLISHQDQVTALPPDAELIAGDDFCAYASYQIGDHILTFQGHPEFTPEYARQRMHDRREIIGEQRYRQGMESLNQNADHLLIAKWIINFLHH
ncbi:MAG: GMP synthase [Gammaproteobacteria bacterium]